MHESLYTNAFYHILLLYTLLYCHSKFCNVILSQLKIRLTNGHALTQTFGAKEPLSAVRLYVEMNRTDAQGPFSLMTSFPRKVFSSADMDMPLDFLGLSKMIVVFFFSSLWD